MQWAAGVTLRCFIEQNIYDVDIFKTVATEFHKIVASLHTKSYSTWRFAGSGNILINRNGTDA